MYGAPPVTAALVPAGSNGNSRLITCASFFSTHAQSYGQEEKQAEQTSHMPCTFKSEDVSSRYIDLDQIPIVKIEAIQRERSAAEIIGANGLLCMRETSSFMPSN